MEPLKADTVVRVSRSVSTGVISLVRGVESELLLQLTPEQASRVARDILELCPSMTLTQERDEALRYQHRSEEMFGFMQRLFGINEPGGVGDDPTDVFVIAELAMETEKARADTADTKLAATEAAIRALVDKWRQAGSDRARHSYVCVTFIACADALLAVLGPGTDTEP